MEKVLAEIKKFITKPVTNLMEKEQNETIKVSSIKALVVALVTALAFILIMVGVIESTFNAYSGLAKLGGTDSFNQAKSLAYAGADLFGWFIKVFFGIIILVAVVAGVLFVVSKLLKVKKEFKNSLALAANYSIYLGVGTILYSILAFIYAPLAAGVLIIISLLSSYALKYAYKNSLGDGIDDDKLAIYATLVVGVVTIVAAIIVGGIVSSSMMSLSGSSLNSLTGSGSRSNSLNSLNSLKDLLK